MEYDPVFGVANSGDSLVVDSQLYFAAGHANGIVSLWRRETDSPTFRFLKAIDVKNPKPANPWGIHNIRGIATLAEDRNRYIVSGWAFYSATLPVFTVWMTLTCGVPSKSILLTSRCLTPLRNACSLPAHDAVRFLNQLHRRSVARLLRR